MEDSRLVKEPVVFGEMEGKTKRERPKRECLDDVKKWCNKEIYILQKKAQDRDAWKLRFDDNSSTGISSTTLRLQTFRLLLYTSV